MIKILKRKLVSNLAVMCQIVAMCQTEERYILLRICYENEKMCFAKRHNSKVLEILIKCTVYIAAISELQHIVDSNESYLRHIPSYLLLA